MSAEDADALDVDIAAAAVPSLKRARSDDSDDEDAFLLGGRGGTLSPAGGGMGAGKGAAAINFKAVKLKRQKSSKSVTMGPSAGGAGAARSHASALDRLRAASGKQGGISASEGRRLPKFLGPTVPVYLKNRGSVGNTGMRKTAFDIDVANLTMKGWEGIGHQLDDYFNYGLDEDTWSQWRDEQVRKRLASTGGGIFYKNDERVPPASGAAAPIANLHKRG